MRFIVDGKLVGERQLVELTRLVEVVSGSILYSTEEEFTVLEFLDEVWVVPNRTPFFWAYSHWCKRLNEARIYFHADLVCIPEQWALRKLLFFNSALPKAGIYPVSSLPRWDLEGPMDAEHWDTKLSL